MSCKRPKILNYAAVAVILFFNTKFAFPNTQAQADMNYKCASSPFYVF